MLFDSNIIFLDFDGVLTAKSNGTYFPDDPTSYMHSKIHVDRLKQLCSDSDSKIVIASNWRKFDSNGSWTPFLGKTYFNPLPNLKTCLGELIVGQLPAIRHVSKAEALRIWLLDNSISKKFVILDDDLREGYQDSEFKDNFIRVDSEYGIDEDIYEQCIEKLK